MSRPLNNPINDKFKTEWGLLVCIITIKMKITQFSKSFLLFMLFIFLFIYYFLFYVYVLFDKHKHAHHWQMTK